MLLKAKGWLRRVAASAASLSRTTVCALAGILGIAVLVGVISLVDVSRSSSFSVQSASGLEAEAGTARDDDAAEEAPVVIAVHVGGCVANPGVYELPEGSRLLAFVVAAGGLTEEAFADGVNLARIVHDGEHIVIPAQGEAGVESGRSGTSPGLVSVNLADQEELCTLDGIGSVLARRIIAYRERIGGFTSLTQLMEVSGIGTKRFEAIKDAICL